MDFITSPSVPCLVWPAENCGNYVLDFLQITVCAAPCSIPCDVRSSRLMSIAGRLTASVLESLRSLTASSRQATVGDYMTRTAVPLTLSFLTSCRARLASGSA